MQCLLHSRVSWTLGKVAMAFSLRRVTTAVPVRPGSFWNCFLGARSLHLPPWGGGWFRRCCSYLIEATACPMQVSCDLPPFFKFVCPTDNLIQPHLSPLGIEAVTTVSGHARILQLPVSLPCASFMP